MTLVPPAMRKACEGLAAKGRRYTSSGCLPRAAHQNRLLLWQCGRDEKRFETCECGPTPVPDRLAACLIVRPSAAFSVPSPTLRSGDPAWLAGFLLMLARLPCQTDHRHDDNDQAPYRERQHTHGDTLPSLTVSIGATALRLPSQATLCAKLDGRKRAGGWRVRSQSSCVSTPYEGCIVNEPPAPRGEGQVPACARQQMLYAALCLPSQSASCC